MSEAPPFRDFPSLVADQARRRPQAIAIIDGSRRLAYGEFDRRIDRAAAALQRDGFTPRQVVAICAATSSDYLVVFAGALRAGLTVAPLAPGSTAEQLAAMAADADAVAVFVDAAVAASSVRWPASARIVHLDVPDGERSPTNLPFEAWLGDPDAAPPRPVTIDPRSTFNLIYSSGTTGTPKGIEQSHEMRWGHIHRATIFGYGPDAVTLVATPLYSNTTLVAAIPTLAHGGCLVLMARFDVAAFLELAQRHRATHAMLVPVQYQRLMAYPQFDAFDLSSFQCKFSTSAPFHAALKADVLRRWPGALVEYYGMTEGGGTCVLQAHLRPDKLHTVGQPAEGHDIRLIDEDGREVPRAPGGASAAAGEVVGRSPGMMMSGYHKRPELTAQAEWHDAQGRRYIRTGDIGRFDDEGFLVLVDRRKDMIISGGFNIYPSDLEAVLRQHPAVADVAVVGVASEAWGETPVAFVVRRAGAPETAEALRAWANERVGKTQRIAGLRLVEDLPRSAIGKILKRELRDAWTRESATPGD
ncbi:MAG TPA: class I adenylate-forming enzyme family protein [Burkholderiaceae bacterium]|nr:class I adenylate-forming enzyme family protein [Burkholderiaceae bacterium]